jgi:hypothetical protein
LPVLGLLGKPFRVELFNDIGSILELGSATHNLF